MAFGTVLSVVSFPNSKSRKSGRLLVVGGFIDYWWCILLLELNNPWRNWIVEFEKPNSCAAIEPTISPTNSTSTSRNSSGLGTRTNVGVAFQCYRHSDTGWLKTCSQTCFLAISVWHKFSISTLDLSVNSNFWCHASFSESHTKRFRRSNNTPTPSWPKKFPNFLTWYDRLHGCVLSGTRETKLSKMIVQVHTTQTFHLALWKNIQKDLVVKLSLTLASALGVSVYLKSVFSVTSKLISLSFHPIFVQNCNAVTSPHKS